MSWYLQALREKGRLIHEELRMLQEYDHWVQKTPSLVVAQWMREQRGEPPLQQATPLDLYVLASPTSPIVVTCLMPCSTCRL